jgi:hypothetical protein
MCGVKRTEVQVGDDVYVVEQDGALSVQEGKGMKQTAARVEQLSAFVGEKQFHRIAIILPDKIDNLFAEMVRVDDDAFKLGGLHAV